MQGLVIQLDKAEEGASENGRRKIAHYKRKLGEVLAAKDRDDALLAKLEGRLRREKMI